MKVIFVCFASFDSSDIQNICSVIFYPNYSLIIIMVLIYIDFLTYHYLLVFKQIFLNHFPLSFHNNLRINRCLIYIIHYNFYFDLVTATASFQTDQVVLNWLKLFKICLLFGCLLFYGFLYLIQHSLYYYNLSYAQKIFLQFNSPISHYMH